MSETLLMEFRCSKKTGSCFFLPDGIRSEMSRRAHSIKNGCLSKDFFDIVILPLDEYLKQLHANFISSEAFVAVSEMDLDILVNREIGSDRSCCIHDEIE